VTKTAIHRAIMTGLSLAALGGASALAASAGSKYWVEDSKLSSTQGYGAAVVRGMQVYDRWCADCHGPGSGRYGRGLTGVEALEAKYNGEVPPLLSERTDLTPETVAFFVRNGVTVMPFFRKTEISDKELADLGAYLSRLNPEAGSSESGGPVK
jgi:mono/diheme cytochrome c family protein